MAFHNDDEQDELQRQMGGVQAPMDMGGGMPEMGGGASPLDALKMPAAPSMSQGPVNVAQAGAGRGTAGPAEAMGAPMPAPMPGGGDRAAQAKAAQAAGYKDIGDTNPLKTGDFTGQLSGFNTGGWGSGERGTGTMKNKLGQAMTRYDVTQPGAATRLVNDPDVKEYWPDAEVQNPPKNDMVDWDGPGPMKAVDVIGDAVEGGSGTKWRWGADEGGAGASAGGPAVNGLMNGDPMADINAQIEALMNGQDGEEQNLIQQMLRGEGI